MGILDTAASVYRDHTTIGVPSSGKHKPVKSEIRLLFEEIQGRLGQPAIRPEDYGFVQADAATHVPAILAAWNAARAKTPLVYSAAVLDARRIVVDLTGVSVSLTEPLALPMPARGITLKLGDARNIFPTAQPTRGLIELIDPAPVNYSSSMLVVESAHMDCAHKSMGIRMEGVLRSEVRFNNIIHQLGVGIDVTTGSGGYIGGNHIQYNTIHQWRSDEAADLNDNTKRTAIGIRWTGGGDSTISRNLIGWGGDCIVVTGATAMNIHDNHPYCGSLNKPQVASYAAPVACTVTPGAPGTINLTGHGLLENTPVVISSSGSMPGGTSAGVRYYTRNVTANTFQLTATPGGSSTPLVAISSAGTGTISIWNAPMSTAFNGNVIKLVGCFSYDVQRNYCDSGEVWVEDGFEGVIANNRMYYNGINYSSNPAFIRLHATQANTFSYPRMFGDIAHGSSPLGNPAVAGAPVAPPLQMVRYTTGGAGSFANNVAALTLGRRSINALQEAEIFVNMGDTGALVARFMSSSPTLGTVAMHGMSTVFAPEFGADGDSAIIRTAGTTRIRAATVGQVTLDGGLDTVSALTTRGNDGVIHRFNTGGSSSLDVSLFAGQVFVQSVGNILNIGSQGSHAVQLTTNNVARAVWSNTSYYPATDNAVELGGTSFRWSVVRAVNGTIQTSDQRLKVFFSDIVDARDITQTDATEIVRSLRPGLFRWKVGGRETESIQVGTRMVERQVIHKVERPVTRVEIRDGVAVEITTVQTVDEPAFRMVPLVDEKGDPVIEIVSPARTEMQRKPSGEFVPVTIPAETRQKMHPVPVMETVEEPVFGEVTTEKAGRRAHLGIRAQDLKATLDRLGLDFSMWGLEDATDPDSEQHVRPDQMVWVLTLALQAMEARLTALESRKR
jgi:hypothetical protein